MRFTIPDPNKKRNIVSFFRQAGYHFENKVRLPAERQGDLEISFYRSAREGDFPRFHIYLKEAQDGPPAGEAGWEANLHLDQKRPSYSGSAAHAGEYEGRVVEEEVKRIKAFLAKADIHR